MGKGHKPRGGGSWDGDHQHKALYNSKRWRDLRLIILTRSPLCVPCREKGRLVPATTVHHVKPHRGDQSLFWDSTNLQSVCSSCHSGEIQMSEKRGYHSTVGTDGWPIDSNHPFNKS